MRFRQNKMKEDEKASIVLFIACWLIYAIISMTKNAFSSSISSIIEEGILSKSLVGAINASYYLFYGGAQLLLVKKIDKVSSVKLINISIIGALISMFGFAVAKSFWVMFVLWSITGLLQFALWPAIMRIISQKLIPIHRNSAMIYIAFSYCIGMLSNYFLASLILKVSGWRMIFNIFAVVMIVSAFLWLYFSKRSLSVLEKYEDTETKNVLEDKEKKKNPGTLKVVISSGVMFMLVPSLVRTMLDLGLKSWIPIMIIENYDISASFANMLTTILLVVNLIGIFIVNKFHPKYIKSEALCFSLCFIISIPFTLLLIFIGKIPLPLVIVLLTILTTFMYSGHQLINVIIPSRFAKINLSGGIASLLNGIASFGAVIANFGFGYLADNYGWISTIISWNILAAIAAVFGILSVKPWNKFMK